MAINRTFCRTRTSGKELSSRRGGKQEGEEEKKEPTSNKAFQRGLFFTEKPYPPMHTVMAAIGEENYFIMKSALHNKVKNDEQDVEAERVQQK